MPFKSSKYWLPLWALCRTEPFLPTCISLTGREIYFLFLPSRVALRGSNLRILFHWGDKSINIILKKNCTHVRLHEYGIGSGNSCGPHWNMMQCHQLKSQPLRVRFLIDTVIPQCPQRCVPESAVEEHWILHTQRDFCPPTPGQSSLYKPGTVWWIPSMAPPGLWGH